MGKVGRFLDPLPYPSLPYQRTNRMLQAENVLSCYGKTAEAYADAFAHELSCKPLDRMLLTRFAQENRHRGVIIDVGCGPGQTTAFLHRAGLAEIVGLDLSPAMVAIARQRNESSLRFEVADMLHLPCADQTVGGAVAFYSIVHLTMYELALAFEEIYRVLKPQGQLLLAFHAHHEGEQRVYPQVDFLGQPVAITFYFFDPDEVVSLAREAGFTCQDALVRHPYAEEHPSKRAYLLFSKA